MAGVFYPVCAGKRWSLFFHEIHHIRMWICRDVFSHALDIHAESMCVWLGRRAFIPFAPVPVSEHRVISHLLSRIFPSVQELCIVRGCMQSDGLGLLSPFPVKQGLARVGPAKQWLNSFFCSRYSRNAFICLDWSHVEIVVLQAEYWYNSHRLKPKIKRESREMTHVCLKPKIKPRSTSPSYLKPQTNDKEHKDNCKTQVSNKGIAAATQGFSMFFKCACYVSHFTFIGSWSWERVGVKCAHLV